MIKAEDLYEAYYDCRRNKRKTANALLFELNYEEYLTQLLNDINNRTYEIGKSICFVITKPKIREVFAADFRDRIVHHLVIRKLEPLFESYFIEDTYNCRKDKGVLYGVGRLQEKIDDATEHFTKDAWIAKFDCKGFFMSIHRPTLWMMLRKFIEERYEGEDKEDILYLTEKIVLNRPQDNCIKKSSPAMWEKLDKNKSLFTCEHDCGLPIGNLSSQTFANFYLSEFDKYMVGRFNGFYGRYVDDFYVIVHDKKDILGELEHIKSMLSELHITLHPDKIYLQHYSKGVRFVGGYIKFGRRYLNNQTIGRFRNRIDEYNNIKDKEENTIKFTQSINSYLGLLGQYMEYKTRKREMLRMKRKWYKYVYISGSYKKLTVKQRYKPDYSKTLDIYTMVRKTDLAVNYCPVKKLAENRYRVDFDKVPIIIEEKESELATWSENLYKETPTTEQVQSDVIAMTIQRYKDEGLVPPEEKDIDVSEYIID